MEQQENQVYQTPQSDVSISQEVEVFPIASKGKRFLNMIVDTIGFYTLAFILGVITAVFGVESIWTDVNEYLLALIVVLLYYVPQEALLGRTLGKFLTGTKVVTYQNEKISAGQAFGRSLCRMIPFEAFSVLMTNPTLGWHDSIAKTKVVDVRAVVQK